MARASTLLETIGNPTLGQIIWGELDEHFVADEDADAVLAHLAGGVAEDLMIRSEEHTSELQSLMRISYAVFCLKKKKTIHQTIYKDKRIITIHTGTIKKSHRI